LAGPPGRARLAKLARTWPTRRGCIGRHSAGKPSSPPAGRETYWLKKTVSRASVHGAVVGRRFRSVTKLTTKVGIGRGYLWGSFLIAAAALKTPTRNGYNAQGVVTISLLLPRDSPRHPQTEGPDNEKTVTKLAAASGDIRLSSANTGIKTNCMNRYMSGYNRPHPTLRAEQKHFKDSIRLHPAFTFSTCDAGNVLAFTRDSFSSRLCTRSNSIICKQPLCLGTPHSPIHRPRYCAIQGVPPTIHCCITRTHTILGMAMSCTCHDTYCLVRCGRSAGDVPVKTRRWECDRPRVEPTSSGCIVWGQYHSSEKVSCDEWYWNPSPHISGYMCGARRVVRGLCCSQQCRCGSCPLLNSEAYLGFTRYCHDQYCIVDGLTRAAARRPKEASREKSRLPPRSRGSSP